MTETRELRIPHKEMTTVAFTCPHCGAEVVVDIADKRQRKTWDDAAQFACPICRANFDSNLKGAMIRLRDWFELVEKSGAIVTFRVRIVAKE